MSSAQVPKIAVLLAAYQGGQWIAEQVASILNQSDVSVTLYISVDRCNDGTYEWAEKCAARHESVVVLPYGERFGGAGANFFRLLKEVALGEYDAVALADQDDVWLPEKLQRAWSFLASGQCDAFSSDVLAFWPDGQEHLIKKSYPQQRFDHYFEAAGPGCTYVLSKATAIQLQCFLRAQKVELLASVELHDWFIYAFVRQQGLVWYIDDRPLMRYRQHDANEVGVNKGLRAYRKRLFQVLSDHYRQQVNQQLLLLNPELARAFSHYGYRVLHAWHCRRRLRDKFVLLVMFLFRLY